MLYRENIKELDVCKRRLSVMYSLKLNREFTKDFPYIDNMIAMRMELLDNIDTDFELRSNRGRAEPTDPNPKPHIGKYAALLSHKARTKPAQRPQNARKTPATRPQHARI